MKRISLCIQHNSGHENYLSATEAVFFPLYACALYLYKYGYKHIAHWVDTYIKKCKAMAYSMTRINQGESQQPTISDNIVIIKLKIIHRIPMDDDM